MSARWSKYKLWIALALISLTTSPSMEGCQKYAGTTSAEPIQADELMLYNWADYMPQSVLMPSSRNTA